jgi:hypothetical protein
LRDKPLQLVLALIGEGRDLAQVGYQGFDAGFVGWCAHLRL